MASKDNNSIHGKLTEPIKTRLIDSPLAEPSEESLSRRDNYDDDDFFADIGDTDSFYDGSRTVRIFFFLPTMKNVSICIAFFNIFFWIFCYDFFFQRTIWVTKITAVVANLLPNVLARRSIH